MTEEKKVSVSDDCIGCGACTNDVLKNGEKLFEINDASTKSEFIYKGEITDEVEQVIQEAIDNCPVGAISIE